MSAAIDELELFSAVEGVSASDLLYVPLVRSEDPLSASSDPFHLVDDSNLLDSSERDRALSSRYATAPNFAEGLCRSDLFETARVFLPPDERHAFDELRTEKASAARAIVNAWSGPIAHTIAARQLELIEMAVEEYPETEVPGRQALESALDFFSGNLDLASPSLSLTSTGHVWAQWRDENRAAAIEFRKDGSVNLAAFFPDPEEPMRTSSIANSMSWKAAAREIRSNPGLRWLFVR